MIDKFYSVDQVAENLGLARETVIKLITSRKLSALAVGRQWRISQSHLDDFYTHNTIRAKTSTEAPRAEVQSL